LEAAAAHGVTPGQVLLRWGTQRGQGDKISHIDMGDDRIDPVISHIISLISHIDIQDDHIDMLDNHIDTPYPKSIYYIPYRYSDRYLIEVRSPISISHIDLPYRSPDHILSLWRVEPDRYRPPPHLTHLEPLSFELNGTYDVANNVHLALSEGAASFQKLHGPSAWRKTSGSLPKTPISTSRYGLELAPFRARI